MALGTPSFISRSTATNRMARPGAAMPAIGAGAKATTLPAFLPRGNWTTLEGPPSASIPPGGPATPTPRPPGAGSPMPPTTGGQPAYTQPSMANAEAAQRAAAQNALQQAIAFFEGMSGPQRALLQEQASRIMGQVGYLEANADTQRRILNDQLGIDLASLGLNRQDNQIQRDALTRELDLLAKSGALDSRSFNEAMQNLGLNEQDITRNLGSIDSLEHLANQIHNQRLYGFGVDENENLRNRDLGLSDATRSRDTGLRTTRSDAAARGAMTSSGQVANERDIQGQYGDQVTDITGRYQNTSDRIGIARNTSAFNRMEQQVGFENQRGQGRTNLARNKNSKDEAQIAFERAGINNISTEGQLKDNRRRLELDAWQMGLDENTLRNNLQQGLSQLGLSTVMDVNQLLDNLTSNNLQARQVAEQIYTQALGYAGFFGGGSAPGLPSPPNNPNPSNGGRTAAPARNPDTGQRLNLTGRLTSVGGHQFDEGFAPIAKAILDIGGVTITSSHRTPERNRQVGGVPNSQHTRGSAADIRTRGLTAAQRKHIENIARGFGLELIDEGDHLHIEMR